MSDVTQILSRIEAGDPTASAHLLPLVYDELRRLASARLANETPGQTLQATALVHEAYVRLVNGREAHDWNSRWHFFGAAAEAMRRILVERARRKKRLRHGGHLHRLAVDDLDQAFQMPADEFLILEEALQDLASHDAVAAQLVQLRYFAGLTVEQAAEALQIGRSTAYEHWTYARAWLFAALRSNAVNE